MKVILKKGALVSLFNVNTKEQLISVIISDKELMFDMNEVFDGRFNNRWYAYTAPYPIWDYKDVTHLEWVKSNDNEYLL